MKVYLSIFFTELALGPLWSSSRDVNIFIALYLYIYVPFSCNLFRGLSLALRLWQDQPGSRLLAGSNRQQTVGRINQVADRGDGQSAPPVDSRQ